MRLMKKSISKVYNTTVVMLVATLLFILVSVFLFQRIGTGSEDTISTTQCYQSVRQQAFLNTNVRFFTTGLKCPLNLVDIPSTASKDDIKPILADEMLNCWENFGSGELELFKEPTGKFCHICSHIIVPAKGIELKGTDFLSFLEEPVQSTNPQRSGKTYAQLLYPKVQNAEKYFSDDQMAELRKSDVAIIDTDKNKDYAMVFWYVKGRSAMENFYAKADAATPGLKMAGAGIGLLYIGGKIIATAGIAIASFVGWPIALVGGSVFLGGGWIAYILGDYAREPPSWMANTYIVPYDKDTLSSLGCEIAET